MRRSDACRVLLHDATSRGYAPGMAPTIKPVLLSLLAIFPTALTAAEHVQPSDLSITCNGNGAVVVVNSGKAAGETLYLGKTCDAARKSGGTGSWWNGASGFVVEIEGEPYGFIHEGPNCSALTFCSSD